MANKNRQKAQRMATRGATKQEIKKATGLSGQSAQKVVSNWSPAAMAASPPTVKQVKSAGVSTSRAKAIVDRATGAYNAAQSSSSSSSSDSSSDGASSNAAGGAASVDLSNLVTKGELEAGIRGAELGAYERAQRYTADVNKAIAQLQEAGATERLKYEVDNKIPMIQAEAKGKLDLQRIVNAGYQNIANIERGSDMFRSIMGAFNF